MLGYLEHLLCALYEKIERQKWNRCVFWHFALKCQKLGFTIENLGVGTDVINQNGFPFFSDTKIR